MTKYLEVGLIIAVVAIILYSCWAFIRMQKKKAPGGMCWASFIIFIIILVTATVLTDNILYITITGAVAGLIAAIINILLTKK